MTDISKAQQDLRVHASGDWFTKLKIEGALLGSSVSYSRNPTDVQSDGLFVMGQPAALNQTYSLANNGKRAILLVSGTAQQYSEDMLTLFGVGIASENVVPRTNNLVVRGEEIAELFSGINIGVSGRASISSYLVPISPSSRCLGTGYVSKSTNKSRCLAVEVTFESGSAIIMVVPRVYSGSSLYQSRIVPIMDDVIEQLDNKRASIELLRWLMEM